MGVDYGCDRIGSIMKTIYEFKYKSAKDAKNQKKSETRRDTKHK
jgi:hypothetical protein